MTEFEKSLNRIKRNVMPCDWSEEDILHYETIKKALEKQIPKLRHYWYEKKVKDTQLVTVCPECRLCTYTNINEKPKHCCWCGKALEWQDRPTEKGGADNA